MKRVSLIVGIFVVIAVVWHTFLGLPPQRGPIQKPDVARAATLGGAGASASTVNRSTPGADEANTRKGREPSFASDKHAAEMHQHTASAGKLSAFDVRAGTRTDVSVKEGARAAAVERMKLRNPTVQIATERITGAAIGITVPGELLTGPGGKGGVMPEHAVVDAADKHGSLKAFLNEYSDLFGHGPEILGQSITNRDFVTAHNGLRTSAWQQQVDGIPITGAELRTHITKDGALANVLNGFIPDAEKAADQDSERRKERVSNPFISAGRAVSLASSNLEEPVGEEQVGERSDTKSVVQSVR
jgi:hypothetical protein